MATATQPVLDLKVGDKVLYEFKEAMIERLDIWGGSMDFDGVSMGFNYKTTKLFPVTEDGQKVALTFRQLYDGVREKPGARNLNYPAITQHVCKLFNITMIALQEGDYAGAAEKLGLAMEFFTVLKNELHQAMKLTAVEGIPLFRS